MLRKSAEMQIAYALALLVGSNLFSYHFYLPLYHSDTTTELLIGRV